MEPKPVLGFAVVPVGEAVYRIAITPNPSRRYLLAKPEALPSHQELFCRYLLCWQAWQIVQARW